MVRETDESCIKIHKCVNWLSSLIKQLVNRARETDRVSVCEREQEIDMSRKSSHVHF